MLKQTAIGLTGAVVLLFSTAGAVKAASFQGLGASVSVRALSDDGSTVVGYGGNATNNEAFRWTTAGGVEALGDLEGGQVLSEALGVSGDGSIVVGWSASSDADPKYEAFLWTAATGMEPLGTFDDDFLAVTAYDISADGTTVVGDSNDNDAFRWTAAGGIERLGNLGGEILGSVARGVSADGATVVGESVSDAGLEVFRWTAAEGMVGLGTFSGDEIIAHSVSADGSTIVGQARIANGQEAFRWTATEGLVGLGNLNGSSWHEAYDVSADGSIIVGESGATAFRDAAAFIWTESAGMVNLQTLLTETFDLDLTGWTLFEARGISADGLTIAGNGQNPDGEWEPWIVTLHEAPPQPESVPEPASLLGLFAIAAMASGSVLKHQQKAN